jgi:hypothetical protein
MSLSKPDGRKIVSGVSATVLKEPSPNPAVPIRPSGYFADALSQAEIDEDNLTARLLLKKSSR